MIPIPKYQRCLNIYFRQIKYVHVLFITLEKKEKATKNEKCSSENKTAWLLAQARATKAVLFSEAKRRATKADSCFLPSKGLNPFFLSLKIV